MLCRILMPHRNDIVPETLEAVKHWPREWGGIRFEVRDLYNSGIIGARNNLLWGGFGNDPFDDSPDMYLFWDSDIAAGIDDFAMMYQLEKPVVFGLYPFNKSKDQENYFVGGCFQKGYPGCKYPSDNIPVTEKRLFEGDNLWAGLGFTLIRGPVLKKLKYPWIDSFAVRAPPEYPRGQEIVTDDVGFCLKLHRARIPVVLDGRLDLSHIKRQGQGGHERPSTGQSGGGLRSRALAAISTITEMAEKLK